MAARKPSPPKAAMQKRILIVDDHPMMREGLRGVINREPDMMVCGEAENAQQAMNAVQKLAPDLALVDITLPGKSGLELVKDLKAMYPHVVILAISMHDESLYAERALRAGAKGYVMKHSAAKNIVAALRRIRGGEIYVSEELRSRLVARAIDGKPGKKSSGLGQLSDRELEVFRLIGQGLKKSELALRLKLSVNTIESHRASLKRKLNVNSSSELARLAILHVEGEHDH